ncbi:MAG: peptidoglycan-binding domain-containing protein [Candidatus Paceibacterota bacterium]|jgi:hypothetical protein
MFSLKKIRTLILVVGIVIFILPSFVSADTLDQEADFNIDPSYDSHGRKEITAVLRKATDQLYFYVDRTWWRELSSSERRSLDVSFYNLAAEFEKRIYPILTSAFGLEPKLGTEDEKITILIHPMVAEAGGYTNSGDVYEKVQNPASNERAMIYLNSRYIADSEAKEFLAHEFTHLITVNQKDLLRGVVEEVWLNEARAEYSATLLGYDDIYKGSNLERRVKDFLSRPTVSLTEWSNKREDYGAANLFIQYLVDHYKIEILADSLQLDKVGIESINLALEENNYDKDFEQIFSDWAITLLVNDCDLGDKYCYRNDNLKNFRITPTIYYLPKAETILSTYHSSAYWALNWHRLIGGGSNLILEFEGADAVGFNVPYLLCDLKNNCSVEFLELDKNQDGGIDIAEFSSQYISLTLIPFISSKVSGFNGVGRSFSFSWQVTVEDKSAEEKEAQLIAQLLVQIEGLKRQIAEYQARLGIVSGDSASCQRIDNNLYFGMTNNQQISCLQEFLKNQGTDIYPEGLVTGNFLSLTQQAVIRFQEKYASEILVPLSLERGTGYVGQATRDKINSLISQ